MEEDKKGDSGDLFAEDDPEEKDIDRESLVEKALLYSDKYKRVWNEDTDELRKKQRDKMFKSMRMYEDDLPELIIPEAEVKPNDINMDSAEGIPEIEPENIAITLQEFNDENPEVCIIGLKKIRSMLSKERVDLTQNVLGYGVLPRLLEMLKSFDKPPIQLEAAWCISNIAAGNEVQVKKITDGGGIELLKGILSSPHRNNQEQVFLM